MLNKIIAGSVVSLLMSGVAFAERTLTFGMQDNEVSNVYQGALAFKEELEKTSGGEMTVNLFPSSSLGDFKAMVA